jgi:hypothetical protein
LWLINRPTTAPSFFKVSCIYETRSSITKKPILHTISMNFILILLLEVAR